MWCGCGRRRIDRRVRCVYDVRSVSDVWGVGGDVVRHHGNSVRVGSWFSCWPCGGDGARSALYLTGMGKATVLSSIRLHPPPVQKLKSRKIQLSNVIGRGMRRHLKTSQGAVRSLQNSQSRMMSTFHGRIFAIQFLPFFSWRACPSLQAHAYNRWGAVLGRCYSTQNIGFHRLTSLCATLFYKNHKYLRKRHYHVYVFLYRAVPCPCSTGAFLFSGPFIGRARNSPITFRFRLEIRDYCFCNLFECVSILGVLYDW